MDNNIKCYYQKEIKKYSGFDSEYFPKRLQGSKHISRLKIHASPGQYEEILDSFKIPDLCWIAFATDIDNSVKGFQTCQLSWFQKFKLSGLYEFEWQTLFYVIGQLKDIIIKTNGSGIWERGVGIALPLREVTLDTISQAIDIQVSMGKKFVNAIVNDFQCGIIANADGYGLDIIWNTDWEQSPKIEEWANIVSNEYKWGGYPFVEA
jgi:hypothetical protein